MNKTLWISLLGVSILWTFNPGLGQAQNGVSLEGVVVKKQESEAVAGFSWIEKDRLAAMARPGKKRDLHMDLAFLREAGIEVLISLTEEPISPEDLKAYGISGLHLPVKDFTPPTLKQIERFLQAVEQAQERGQAVGVHCTAGQGRTGTLMATYFVQQGLTAADAIAEIRRLRPGSVETADQEKKVAEFARTIAPSP